MSEDSGLRLRVATYNVRGCVGMDGRRSEARIAEVIGGLSADIVGLQELDLRRPRSAGADQAGLIAEQLGWHRFFHPAMRGEKEQYGDAVISRFPLQVRQAEELPCASPWYCRENRAAIWAEAETGAGAVQVINTHFGLGRRERFSQAQILAGPRWLGQIPSGAPLIVLGDFNSLPNSRAYRLLAAHLRDARSFFDHPPALRTFPTRAPFFAVDHIFVNACFRAIQVAVGRSPLARIASDHFPLWADLSLNPALRSG